MRELMVVGQGMEGEEKLSQAVSFLNAPGTPDPTIRFTEEKGRRVPVAIGMPR